MDKGYLNEVKAILKSLVLSCPHKMTVDKLNRDFRDVEGELIPFRRLGYKDIDQFLRSIPETLRIYGSGPTAMVCFVPNEKSDHIHDMIMEQKKPSRRRRRRSKSKSKNQYVNSTSGRASNRFCNNAQPRRMPGQQLSALQSTSRNHTTISLSVWNAPSQHSSASKYANHRPPCFNNLQYTGYQLPQPNSISFMKLDNIQPATNIVPQTIPKIEKKSIIANMNNNHNASKDQEQLKQLTSLMTSSCQITSPSKGHQTQSPIQSLTSHLQGFQTQAQIKAVAAPSNQFERQPQLKTLTPPALHTEPPPLRIVSFSTDKKTDDLNGVKPLNFLNGVKAPKATKPKIKLSEDIQHFITVPSRCSLNPIGQFCDHNLRDEIDDKVVTKDEPIIHTKTKNVMKKIFDISDDKINDFDEAVPVFAANNTVFRLDFPEYTVRFGQKITPFVLSDDVHIGALLRIFISEIHNPFKFWFHINKDCDELDLLMSQIEGFYTPLDADELRMPILCLTPGQTCAACYNDLWHRAEIVAYPVNNKVKVSFMDYGTVSEVDIKDIKYLASCFAHLPAQAIRGCLSHIKPSFLHWSHEATQYFLSLVSELMLYAKITEIDRENQVLYMILCNTYSEDVILINKAMIHKKFAIHNKDWQEWKIKMNNGKRLHHPLEDFPTFSLLESGEYPSFTELVNLKNRGIDYENIYDNIIFNKSSILNKHENAPEAIRKLPYFLMTTNPFRSDIIKELNGMTA